MTINHFLSEDVNGRDVVVTFDPNRPEAILMADSSHPHYTEILFLLRAGDPAVFNLFDVASGVMAKFEQITERLSWDGTNVLFDGDPLHNSVSAHLSRVIQDGDTENYTAFAKFVEKLESNPNDHSRQQAYDFLAAHSFQITEEGDVVGYKGVQSDGNGGFVSGWRSAVEGRPSAFVDGAPVPPLSAVPNKIGSVVTMPRSEVVHDPSQACQRGLHVSTRSYAESYAHGGAVLEVHINPRDIVSVPTDGGGEKVRVCRYTIARVARDHNGDRPVLRNTNTTVGWQGDVGYRV